MNADSKAEVKPKSGLALTSLVVGALVVGLVLAAIVIVVAGDRTIPCDSASGLDELLVSQSGHIDGGPGGDTCAVPTRATWVLATCALVLPLVVLVALRQSAVDSDR